MFCLCFKNNLLNDTGLSQKRRPSDPNTSSSDASLSQVEMWFFRSLTESRFHEQQSWGSFVSPDRPSGGVPALWQEAGATLTSMSWTISYPLTLKSQIPAQSLYRAGLFTPKCVFSALNECMYCSVLFRLTGYNSFHWSYTPSNPSPIATFRTH